MLFSLLRSDRCMAICCALPAHDSPKNGFTARELLTRLARKYGESATERGRVRAIQRDLQELCKARRIIGSKEEGGGKTLRYRLAPLDQDEPSGHDLSDIRYGLAELGINGELADLVLARLRGANSLFELPPEQFLPLSDTVRLLPRAQLDSAIQGEVVAALRRHKALKVVYRKSGEEERARVLHPVGAIQRGPQYYLIAFDAADRTKGDTIPKMFLFNRIADAAVLDEPLDLPAGITLRSIVVDKSHGDFVRDPTPVLVRLRVRSYVRALLQENYLAPNQQIEPDPSDPDAAIVTAHLPLSGTLHRWVLGFGDKMEVLEPQSLRETVACQARAVTSYYSDIFEAEEEGNDGP